MSVEGFRVISRVAAGQDGVVTADQARQAGLSDDEIQRLCRAGWWQRLARGAYQLNDQFAESTERRAQIRAAVASLGRGATAVLATAAELHGIAGLRRSAQIHVSVPVHAPRAQRPADPRIVVHQLTLSPADLTTVEGIPTTTAVRTVADVILRSDRYSAVCLLDSALNRGVLTDDELSLIPALVRGRRGALAARRYLAEADGRAQSPLETRVRLRCVDGKVAPDSLQQEVRDHDGYLLAVGDLAWRRARVIAEADGASPHSTPEALFEDRRRQNRLANAGWTVLRFTWADTLRPDYVPEVVRAALYRVDQGVLAQTRRTW